MKKKLAVLLSMAVMTLGFAACGDKAEATDAPTEATTEAVVEEATAGQPTEMEYISENGWRVTYDPTVIEASKTDAGANFVYIGESAGTNMVTISYIKDKQPAEALYDITSKWGADEEDITRYEGIFPGTEDKWGFWRKYDTKEGNTGLSETAMAAEYNDGVLVFNIVNHFADDEEVDIPVSGAIENLINSIKYEDYKDQTLFYYVPGVYKSVDEDGLETSVELKEDHTGTLHFQDDIDIIWSSYEVYDEEESFRYEYSIEQNTLYLDYDGNTLEFIREGATPTDPSEDK